MRGVGCEQGALATRSPPEFLVAQKTVRVLTFRGIVSCKRGQGWCASVYMPVSCALRSVSGRTQTAINTTYAEHLEVGRAPRRAIDPLELNWLPALESRVVVAGIVSGCRCAEIYSKRLK